MDASDVSAIIIGTLNSSSHIVIICFVGALLNRKGFYPEAVQNGINDLLTYLFIPCLLFAKVGSTITVDKFVECWSLPVFSIFYFVLGVLLSILVGKYILHLTSRVHYNFMITTIGIANSTSIPLAVMNKIILKTPSFLKDANDTASEATNRGLAYVLFYTIFINILRWTVGFKLLQNQKKEGILFDKSAGKDIQSKTDDQVELPILTERDATETPFNDSPQQTESFFKRNWKIVWTHLRDLINLPLISVFISLFIGLVPFLKGIFFGENAPLYDWITANIEELSSAALSVTLLNLGAKLSKGPRFNSTPDSISKSTFLSIVILKLIVVPLIGAGMVALLRYLNTFGFQDPVLLFVLMLQGASPTAINLSILATLHKNLEQDMANLLFFSYLASIVTITLNSILFIVIIR